MFRQLRLGFGVDLNTEDFTDSREKIANGTLELVFRSCITRQIESMLQAGCKGFNPNYS